MEPTITADIVVAYAQCPRKAYLLLFSPDKGEPHEYVQILEQQQCANQERYIDHLQASAFFGFNFSVVTKGQDVWKLRDHATNASMISQTT